LVIDPPGRMDRFEPNSQHLEFLRERHEREAVDRVLCVPPDLVLLPLGSDLASSLQLLERLRRTSRIGIVTLGATNELAEGVRALEAGADDHLTTPFHDVDLIARLRAVRRRTAAPAVPLLIATGEGRLIIDLARHEVTRDGERLHLTGTELRLLELLVTNPGVLLTHRELLERIWGAQYGTESNYLRVYVARLRKRLQDPADQPELIETATGIGYRWIAAARPLSSRTVAPSDDMPELASGSARR
ncbi:MAG: response regulator transcription factor, partial [Nitriliruptoraceae bacterium]